MREGVRGLIEEVLFFRDRNATFFDPQRFPWAAAVEAEWLSIRKELDILLTDWEQIPNFQDVSADQKALTDGAQWKTFWLYAYGEKAEENCARCPETVRALRHIPGMKSAMFSILAPRKHIPEHRGMWKGVLRYHLGLIVPEPKGGSRIRVGKDTRFWVEGKSMIFDDSHPHEVWNDCDSRRVVLFVDFVRPTYFPASLLNLAVITLTARSASIAEPMRLIRQYGREAAKTAGAVHGDHTLAGKA
jgi:ornithine lipid ester-linked acyl 2-hydroxylase